MAHGTPDWGVTAGAVTTYQLTDMGELAVRLGSIVSFDRRGDVIWMDDFESGLDKWLLNFSGTGATIELTTDWARSGRYAASLVAADDGSSSSDITRRLPFPALSRLAFEYSFQLSGSIGLLETVIQVFDGTNRTIYGVRWRDTDNDLQYLDADGNYVTFATGVNLFNPNETHHTLKLVVNTEDKEYLRFILDDTEYSLADIGARVAVNSTSPYLLVQSLLVGRSGQNDYAYIDDAIITQNEPA